VRDHNGQALAYVYFEDEVGRRLLRATRRVDEYRSAVRAIAETITSGRGEGQTGQLHFPV